MKSLVARIKKLYGLELHSPERVAKGFLSENHILLGDGTKYFLKRYRFDSKDRIQEIHVAKRYFADGGIPVILPIVNKESSTFFFCDGGYFALFPFVIGWQPERGSLSDIAVESLGETLGRIHLFGER